MQFPGEGGDTLTGGAGEDTAWYGGASSGVKASLLDASSNTGEASGDSYTGIENLYGSGFDDVLTGDGSADRIFGGGGDDEIAGLGGGDQLDGGEGEDTLSYAASGAGVRVDLRRQGDSDPDTAGIQNARVAASGGDATGDTIANFEHVEGSSHGDVLTGDDGANRLSGGGGDDVLEGGAGADRLDGGTGEDTASYADSGAGVNVSLRTGTGRGGDAEGDTLYRSADGLNRIENLRGSSHDDTLTGDGYANRLWGGGGADTLYAEGGDDHLLGGAGADRVYGGDGDDVLEGGAGADRLTGGRGEDTASYAGSTAGVNVSLRTGTGRGGDAEGDTLYRSADGLNRIENLRGSSHDDTLTGDGYANRLWGGAGADTLIGGVGSDVLTGGAGDDLFRFSAGDGADTITDFTDGEDRIDLRGHTGIVSFGDLVIRQSGEDAVVDLGDGDKLTLLGVEVSTLDASDFLL